MKKAFILILILTLFPAQSCYAGVDMKMSTSSPVDNRFYAAIVNLRAVSNNSSLFKYRVLTILALKKSYERENEFVGKVFPIDTFDYLIENGKKEKTEYVANAIKYHLEIALRETSTFEEDGKIRSIINDLYTIQKRIGEVKEYIIEIKNLQDSVIDIQEAHNILTKLITNNELKYLQILNNQGNIKAINERLDKIISRASSSIGAGFVIGCETLKRNQK